MDNAYVLDSFALLAHFEEEVGGEQVRKIFFKKINCDIYSPNSSVLIFIMPMVLFFNSLQCYL